MPASRSCFLTIVLVLCFFTTIRADEPFDDEFALGLLATFRCEGIAVERIDVSPVVEWTDGVVDERLPVGPTHLEWRGQLLIRSEENFQFHAHAIGHVEIAIDGEVVLQHTSPDVAWSSSGDVPMTFGFREIVIRYASPGDVGRCGIYWSADSFALEPLPHHQLFLPEPRPDLVSYERGRQLFATQRCGRCHGGPDSHLSPEAPPLFHVSTGIELSWFEQKLRGHAATGDAASTDVAQGRMPSFGLSDDEVEALTAWLWHMSQPTNTVPVPDTQPDREDVPSGEELFHSVGCLACHQFQGLGHADPWDGGDITNIGMKRSPEWLATWLQQPTRLNPQSAMPVIQMTPTERGRIVEYLTTTDETGELAFEGDDLRPLPDRDLVAEGRELSKSLRCVNCHNIPAQQPEWEAIPTFREGPIDWNRGCLTPLPQSDGSNDAADDGTPRRRPDYSTHFSEGDQLAIQSYVESLAVATSRLSSIAIGERLLEQRNCRSCHDRDGSRGVSAWAGRISMRVDELDGRSQDLVPPNLTSIGDKLRDDILDRALSGRMEERRLPWLSVRMPRFEHSDEELSALRSDLVSRDRIPAGAPRSLQLFDFAETLSPENRELLGRSLVGAGGWSCIACHQVGDYRPRNVALGTRGSDLIGMGQRMRPEFFLRWCQSPLRIIPGMEMPSYQRPVEGVLGNSLDQQMTVLWEALQDPDFEAPTNPAAVEQLLAVEKDSPPIIVRDVFTVSEADGGGYVPRSFAIGFGNGHSLLYDLDELAIRGWTWGDFARQRAEGKSWFWDLAGTPVMSGFVDQCEIALVHASDATPVLPRIDDSRRGRLLDYVTERNHVTLHQELQFPIGDEAATVELEQLFHVFAAPDDQRLHGFRRVVTLTGLPAGWTPQWQPTSLEPQLEHVPIIPLDWEIDSDNGTATCEILYLAKITTPRLVPPTPEPIIVAGPSVLTLPGYLGERLPLPVTIMPTAFAMWNDALVVSSLKGHIYIVKDADGDGVEETATLFEEGLSAPFGLLADGDSLLVTHKAELLRLSDRDGDGRCDHREVVLDGWGFTHDYHDWVTGPARDRQGLLYLGLGSDYAQKDREEQVSRWRGEIIRLEEDGSVTSIAQELRYPIGIAFDHEDRLFVTDQQGVQNTFNELDYIIPGARYGVTGRHDPERTDPAMPAAVQIPHPWTRSVNGLFFLPTDGAWSDHPFAGHGIGCEYNLNFLVRTSVHEVEGQLQGACYEFSHMTWNDPATGMLGPICGMAAYDGSIYVGTMQDSGWLGGLNQGQVIRFRPTDAIPNGIREIRATANGFEVEFVSAVDPSTALTGESYSLSGYTRVWGGSYATEDSGRYAPTIEAVALSPDQTTIRIVCGPLKEGFVYDVGCAGVLDATGEPLFPNVGFYTMNRVPME